jgi:hypothetical protein
MSDTRTDTARANDDSDFIDQAVADSEPDAVASTSGGALAQDVSTQDELNLVNDPDGTTRATKQDDIAAGVAEPSNRARD